MPFDLVAEVRCFFGVERASSKANFKHAVDAGAAHHRFLHHDFALGAGEHLAADRRILALGVLAHHPEVDVAGLAAGERAGHAGHQAHGAQVDVLVELAPEQDQRAPQRDVVGQLVGHADGAEVDRVMAADLLLPVLRHHAAVLFVVVAAREIEIVEAQLEAELLGRGFEHAHAFRHDLLADAVAGNDCDTMNAVGRHGVKVLVRSGRAAARRLFITNHGRATQRYRGAGHAPARHSGNHSRINPETLDQALWVQAAIVNAKTLTDKGAKVPCLV